MRELEAALAARDEFLSIVGHELRNPVSPVFLRVNYMLETARRAPASVTAEWLEPRLEKLLKSLDRFTNTLERVLDVTRINGGRLELHPERTDLSRIAREVCEDYARELAASNSELRLCAGESVIGRWDPLRLQQICSNLVSNAIRYGNGGRIEVEVRLREGNAVLSVTDHGIGIPEKDRERIFERFERVSGSRHPGGFGVGLWLVKQLCDAMGGSVGARSQVGRGSTFTVTLPIHAGASNE